LIIYHLRHDHCVLICSIKCKNESWNEMIGVIRNMVLIMWASLVGVSSHAFHKDQERQQGGGGQYAYLVGRAEKPMNINADWHKATWSRTEAVSLDHHMGEKPDHFPVTHAKLRYDHERIYVIFYVSDRYVKAVAKERNGPVWKDSCVEFFFSPGPDTERGYFNFEANCKGVYLFQYHKDQRKINGFVSKEDCDRINMAWSLERDVEQEIAEPVEWYLEYSIPFSLLEKYMEVEKPAPGVVWRANFYKCADNTSHPHWLTWAPVDFPRPSFHLPAFFGRLKFEQ
jgi:hypothetical protein